MSARGARRYDDTPLSSAPICPDEVEEEKSLMEPLKAAAAAAATVCATCALKTPAGGGKLRWCVGCRFARYCSTDCQKKNWPVHRLVCKVLAVDREILEKMLLGSGTAAEAVEGCMHLASHRRRHLLSQAPLRPFVKVGTICTRTRLALSCCDPGLCDQEWAFHELTLAPSPPFLIARSRPPF